MKQLLSILILSSVALSANAAEDNIPADCKAYYDAIEKLAKKNPAMGAQFSKSMEASKKQWSSAGMTDEQKKAANTSCKQALEQIKPML